MPISVSPFRFHFKRVEGQRDVFHFGIEPTVFLGYFLREDLENMLEWIEAALSGQPERYFSPQLISNEQDAIKLVEKRKK